MEFLEEGVDVLGKAELQEAKAGSCGDYTCYLWLPWFEDPGFCIVVIIKS